MKYLFLALVLLLSFSCVAQINSATLEKDGEDIVVKINGKLFTKYVHGEQKPYLYPVIGPTGINMTRNFPIKKGVKGESQDHPWQSSIYYTHGSVNRLDFWNNYSSRQKNCRIVLDKLISTDKATIIATHKWLNGKKIIMTDKTEISFSGDEQKRIIDFTITLKASHGKVTLGDTKEGCMAVRMHHMLRVKENKASVINSEGITGKKVWGKAAKWITYSNKIEGKTVGITMMDHPQNLRYPTTWHARDYGLCAANPFGLKHFLGKKNNGTYVIEDGKSLTFSYRLIFHSGTSDDIKAQKLHKSWIK